MPQQLLVSEIGDGITIKIQKLNDTKFRLWFNPWLKANVLLLELGLKTDSGIATRSERAMTIDIETMGDIYYGLGFEKLRWVLE